MTHDRQLTLRMHAYIDDELDGTDRKSFEAHIAACPDCQREIAEIRALKAAVAEVGKGFSVPADLESRIRRRLDKAAVRRRMMTTWIWPAGGTLMAAAIGAAILTVQTSSVDAVVTDHRHWRDSGQVVEVSATQAGPLKTWLNDRVDVMPPVLARADGCNAVGARAGRIGRRKASTVIYDCGGHVVDFYAMAEKGRTPASPPIAPHAIEGKAAHVVTWKRGRLECYAVSDLPEPQLVNLARYIQTHALEG